MGYRYTVLGSGRQGIALAYDLILHGEAASVVLADQALGIAKQGAQRLNLLSGRNITSAVSCNAREADELRNAIVGSDVVVSALPYVFNLQAAEIALEAQAHFCDLGGNTSVVLEELKLDSLAREGGVSLLPDCGLAPGLSNLLAARALEKLGPCEFIKVRCGGLPQMPRPPLHYKMVFSLDGLINEYSGNAICLREGRVQSIPGLSEPEEIEIPKIGKLEAWVTTGGTSTAPYSFEGRVENFDYKTLRYPGHFEKMKAYEELGLFSEKPLSLGETSITPKEFFKKLLTPLIDFDDDRDLVVLTVEAKAKNSTESYHALLIDRGDMQTNFTAMERTTSYPTGAIAYLQASGKIPPGAKPIETSVPLDDFLLEIGKRGIEISESIERS